MTDEYYFNYWNQHPDGAAVQPTSRPNMNIVTGYVSGSNPLAQGQSEIVSDLLSIDDVRPKDVDK